MTSRYPDITQVFDNQPYIRQNLPNVITLPQQFKNHGYHTQSLGKIFHGIFESGIRDDSASWSVPPWRPQAIQYLSDRGLDIIKKRYSNYIENIGNVWDAMGKRRLKGLAWEAPALPDDKFMDGKITNKAIKVLQELKGKDSPFFLGVGFVKPHLPFVAPKKYFDLYKNKEIQKSSNRYLPKNASELSHNNSREIRGYDFIPKKGEIPADQVNELILAYNACVSFIDAQIGRIVDELERLDLRDKTIIVLWGDHGYHLGDLGLWSKNTNFENALRVPLIISAPRAPNTGKRIKSLVELIDLMPTLLELAGIPIPNGVQGNSLVPLLEGHPKKYHAKVAFSQGPRPYFGKNAKKYMGYSIRTKKYRYTEWIPQDTTKNKVQRELYYFENSLVETINLASSEEYSRTVKRLSKLLHNKKDEILEAK